MKKLRNRMKQYPQLIVSLTKNQRNILFQGSRTGGFGKLFDQLEQSKKGNTFYLGWLLVERVVTYYYKYKQGGYQNRLKNSGLLKLCESHLEEHK